MNSGTKMDGLSKELLASHARPTVRPLVPVDEGPCVHNPNVLSRVREYERRLGSNNLTVRLKAMKELYDMEGGASPAVFVIAAALHDENDRVRELAAMTLGNLRNTDANNALREALSHEDNSRVVVAIRGSLHKIELP